MRNRIFTLLLAIAVCTGMNAQDSGFMFTEVCVANIDQIIDYSYNYGGWVELYNPTSQDILLDGWYVSNDAGMPAKHQLTGYGTLRPGNYVCLFFDHNATEGEYGPDAARQVGFKLDRKGGSLFFSRNGTDVDLSLTYPESVPRCSYARTSLNADDWQYCGLPTPGQPNDGHYAKETLPVPAVDCDSKLFTSGFDVHVQIPSGTTLRYTTDGSTPTLLRGMTSTDGRFHISQNTVLRLRLFAEGKLPSGVVTRTYIYRDREYYLPIVAVTTDPLNLYDDMIGCYCDGKNGIEGRGSKGKSNLNMDWERPANFEYLTADGRMVINQETSFEVAGGYSRHFEPASFKVQAKKLYDGNGYLDGPVFENKPYCQYKQLLIRNGGNNNRTYGGPRIKDGITQQVLTSSGFYVDAQEYQPAHVFINGKYLAMMNVREPNNRFHGSANYGYDDDETDGFEYSGGSYRQKGGTREAFDQMIQLSYDAETDEGYARVAEVLDIDEFVRYMATICYTGSYDWLLNGNNVKGYRNQENGKFHFVYFDLDLAWERTNNVGDIENVTTNEVLVLYHNLQRNSTFRQQFATSYCILHGSIYTPDRCRQIADSISDLVRDALAFDKRYPDATYDKLEDTMWEQTHREERIRALQKTYGLSDRIDVDIDTDCASARIQIEGIDVPFSQFSGALFGPVSVSTSAADGYRFLGWTDRNGRLIALDRKLTISKDGTYRAVYKHAAAEDLSPVCINEVSAANDTYVNDYGKRSDWIELYNRGQEPIDVARWSFSDDETEPSGYYVSATDGASTVIQPGGHLVLWCDGKTSVSELHLPFKLKNEDGGSLTIQSPDGKWKDSIYYNAHSQKETIGRYPDGGSSYRIFYHPTIGTHNMITSYDSMLNPLSIAMPSQTRTDETEGISYYTISGIKVYRPLGNGIYIEEVRYRNGKRQQRKVVNRTTRERGTE